MLHHHEIYATYPNVYYKPIAPNCAEMRQHKSIYSNLTEPQAYGLHPHCRRA